MYFGWRIVGGSFVSLTFVTGFFTYAVSLLTQPVQQSFSASVEQVMYSLAFGTFLGLFIAPLAGALLDRVSARLLTSTGVAVFALGLYLLSLTQSLTQYILVFGFTMSLANSLAGSMMASALVSRWFSSNRGKALGIAAVGTSVGGVLIPALLTHWIADYGWRAALQNLALILALVVLPLMVFCIRSWPRDIGLQPELSGAQQPQAALRFSQIIRNKNFWWLGLSLGLLLGSYSATLSNLTPFAMSLDYSKQQASSLIMIVAISGLVGKLLFGMASDKFSHKLALWTAHLLVVTSFMLFATQPAYSLSLVAAIALGLAAGAIIPVWGSLMADTFGLANFGKAMGLMAPVITSCVMVAHPLPGRLYEMSGGFSLGFYVFTAAIVAASLLLIPLSTRQSTVAVESGEKEVGAA